MEQSKIEHNRKLIIAYFEEVWNKGKVEFLDELVTEDYKNNSPGFRNPPPGPSGLKPIVLEIRQGFPDIYYAIQDLVITDDKVVARVRLTATHLGEVFGLRPTGKKVEVDQINIERIKDGKICEHWRLTDELQMMKQLGVIG